jgi:hypothetical protein
MFSNAPQSIPETFHEIMENDARLVILLENVLESRTDIDDTKWKELKHRWELKKDLMRAAEQILKWNKDKGK